MNSVVCRYISGRSGPPASTKLMSGKIAVRRHRIAFGAVAVGQIVAREAFHRSDERLPRKSLFPNTTPLCLKML